MKYFVKFCSRKYHNAGFTILSFQVIEATQKLIYFAKKIVYSKFNVTYREVKCILSHIALLLSDIVKKRLFEGKILDFVLCKIITDSSK